MPFTAIKRQRALAPIFGRRHETRTHTRDTYSTHISESHTFTASSRDPPLNPVDACTSLLWTPLLRESGNGELVLLAGNPSALVRKIFVLYESAYLIFFSKEKLVVWVQISTLVFFLQFVNVSYPLTVFLISSYIKIIKIFFLLKQTNSFQIRNTV